MRRKLVEVLTLVERDGLPARFRQVVQGRMGQSSAFIIDGSAPRLAAFSLTDGYRIGALEAPSPHTKIDGVAPLGETGVAGWDRNHKELWLFGPHGEATGPISAPVRGNPGSIIEVVGGSVWIWATESGDFRSEALHRSVSEYTVDGALLRTVRPPPLLRLDPGFALSSESGSLANFPRTREVTWSPRYGLLRGENTSYSFLVERGDTCIAVDVAYAPARLTETEARWWRSKAAEFNAREAARNSGVTYSVPDLKPAFRRLAWDDAGRIWVWRYVAGLSTDSIAAVYPAGSMPVVEPVVQDVFDINGRYLWTVELPPRSRVLDMGRDRLLVATRVANMGDEEIVRVMALAEMPGR